MRNILLGLLACASVNAFAVVGDQPAIPDAQKILKASEYYKYETNCLAGNYNQQTQAIQAIKSLLDNPSKLKEVCTAQGEFSEVCLDEHDAFSLSAQLTGLMGIINAIDNKDLICKYMAPSTGYTVSGIMKNYLGKDQ